jgi:hypothetical protein
MKKGSHTPARIALYGMDDRTSKTMEMYLKGPCRGVAVVVRETEADIDVIDADHPRAKDILEARKAATPNRPIILLSLQNLQIDNTFFIKKPVNVAQIVDVLGKIKAATAPRKAFFNPVKAAVATPEPVEPVKQAPPEAPRKMAMDVYAKKPAGAKHVDTSEQQKTAKHQSAVQLNEGGFTAFLGTVSDIDFDDSAQLLTACYDPRQSFLGYVQSAYKTANLQSRALQLNSIWKPLTIFPETQEIWLDADDKQLRAFAGMALGKSAVGSMVLMAVDNAKAGERAMDKFQNMNTFIWKLALWTSKGRFPIGLDIQRPVFLVTWPNFTRLVITPDALRMAALLVSAPKTPLEVASVLKVKPQYVFAFISACHALGLLRQSERQVDTVIAAEPPKKSTNKSLLSKILGKLLGA